MGSEDFSLRSLKLYSLGARLWKQEELVHSSAVQRLSQPVSWLVAPALGLHQNVPAFPIFRDAPLGSLGHVSGNGEQVTHCPATPVGRKMGDVCFTQGSGSVVLGHSLAKLICFILQCLFLAKFATLPFISSAVWTLAFSYHPLFQLPPLLLGTQKYSSLSVVVWYLSWRTNDT